MKAGPYFQGGPKKDVARMVAATASFRDVGGLPAEASLVLSQLLLNLGGHAGLCLAMDMISEFLDAADVPTDLGGPRLCGVSDPHGDPEFCKLPQGHPGNHCLICPDGTRFWFPAERTT